MTAYLDTGRGDEVAACLSAVDKLQEAINPSFPDIQLSPVPPFSRGHRFQEYSVECRRARV